MSMELKPYYDSDDADSIDLTQSNAHDEDICEELMDDVEIQMPPPRVKIEKPNLDVLESRIIECAVDVHESVFTVLYALHEHFARCNTYTKQEKMNVKNRILGSIRSQNTQIGNDRIPIIENFFNC